MPENTIVTDPVRKQQFFGVFLAVSAFFMWGLFPLYFYLLQEASSYIVLAFRAVTVSVFLVPVICIRHKWSAVLHVLKTPKLFASLCLTATIICVNWWIFIWMVQNQHTLHASFANYICPLFNVVLGIVFFRERLCILRKCAVGLGLIAVIVFAWGIGTIPWGSLAAAGSFSVYSMGRKIIPVDSVSALSIETIAIAPWGLAYIIFAPGGWFDNAVWVHDIPLFTLLIGSGVLTAIPLILFGSATHRIGISTVGFIQYITPTLQFVCAVVFFREAMTMFQWISFVVIWAALIVFSLAPMEPGSSPQV